MKRILVLICGIAAVVLYGCGSGGGGVANSLAQIRQGQTWVFQYEGTVDLPASMGGGTQSVTKENSTITYSVSTTTSKDLNNDTVWILDRKLNLNLLDGRNIKGNFRQYFTQTSRGIYLHGYNNYVGDTINSANDKFVPATVTPPYAFLYMPSPVVGNVSYTNPFGVTGAGDHSYSFAITNTKRVTVTTLAGNFSVMTGSIIEKYGDEYSLTGVGLVPEVVGGFVSANIKATLPDGTKLNGRFQLKSRA